MSFGVYRRESNKQSDQSIDNIIITARRGDSLEDFELCWEER